tara:strand:+ start:27 stop:1229 length:1203 start_codon:yes stop_codon:yes gene_type:complete
MNFKNTDVLILAGGRGTRIKEITSKIPKPLIKFNKKPLLTLILNNISKYNFNKIFILTGYKGNQIKAKYDNQYYNFIKIHCVHEKKRLGTWGAVTNIKKRIKKNFILINGDTVFNPNFENFLKFKLINEDMVMIITNNHFYKENTKLNNLAISSKRKVVFSRKNKLINSGCYYISKKLLSNNSINKSSIENDIIPELIKKKRIGGIVDNKELLDIGTKENLAIAKKRISKIVTKPAVFFDRDGVINHDYGYVHKFKDFKFMPGVIKALKYLSKKNIYIFIVTNQAGIGKGLYKEKDFYILHKNLKNYLANREIFIHDVKYSPFHPKSVIKRYKKISSYRKPGNLMIENLFSNWEIVRNKSFMIGDSVTDELAAKKSRLYFEYPKKDFLQQVKKICEKFKI